uniref:Uncharacterized protein n=1 Tax=Ditylenchus dipsaci TaxID=166011 RepID=A0A915DLY7_9BILA
MAVFNKMIVILFITFLCFGLTQAVQHHCPLSNCLKYSAYPKYCVCNSGNGLCYVQGSFATGNYITPC